MNRKKNNRMQPSYIISSLTTLLNSFFQRRWIQYLLVFVMVTSVASTLYYYRSSYVSVDLPAKSGIPPDPGRKANNKTLLGIDSDEDGVRDDVQRYILALDIDHPFFKQGLLQYARAMQVALAESHEPKRASKNLRLTNQAAECFSAASVVKPHHVSDEVDNVMLNTQLRRKAYKTWVHSIPFAIQPSMNPEEACLFDINSFEGERWL